MNIAKQGYLLLRLYIFSMMEIEHSPCGNAV